MAASKKHNCKQRSTFAETAINHLREAGLRITKSRVSTIQAIEKLGVPFTVASLYEYLCEDLGEQIDFATVYRIVQLLETSGLIHQQQNSKTYLACHHVDCEQFLHLIYSCTSCSAWKEDHLPLNFVRDMQRYLDAQVSFRSQKATLQISGLCPSCSPFPRI